ncbi:MULTISPECIES: hypothetical protein [unclassified Bradyrhizobium]|uniref:hypothetical protein n=1 Tax=unclassified Bradyrhizobium TaxID=2631580 RepID=UPI003398838F
MSPPAQMAVVAQKPSEIIEQQKRSASGESATMLPRPRPSRGTSKATAIASRAKPIVEAKPCQSGAFDALLKALNLQTRCQT